MALEIKLEDSPFIKAYTLAIIKTLAGMHGWKQPEVEVINADLIPQLSEKITQVSIFPQPRRIIHYPKPKAKRTMPVSPTAPLPEGEFGKIDALIKDPSVTTIECPGPAKTIIIIRSGNREATKITLTQEEINEVLKKIAEIARVPLIEGIFRAAVRDFVVESVVSKTIGSRFVIKKYNPFALLELERGKNRYVPPGTPVPKTQAPPAQNPQILKR